MNRVLFSSATPHWATPKDVYSSLNREFRFTLDPCRLQSKTDGLTKNCGGHRVYCNPPYGRGVAEWLKKAREANAVFLLPARTDTKWWHEYAMKADEIRFLKGRLHFNGHKTGAPFPSVILVFRASKTGT